MNKIVWKDITPKNLFTQRNATMRDLHTNKIIQYYSANTKLVVVQETQIGETTYYRTNPAKERKLDWGFEAAVFGLPNKHAPSVPYISFKHSLPPRAAPPRSVKKQKTIQKGRPSKDGEKARPQLSHTPIGWLKRLFRR